MKEIFNRTGLLLGEDGVNKLESAHVCVFGAGGVGSYTIEALVRSGIGEITIIDGDEVALSNVNRQLIATSRNIGKLKVEEAKERCLLINPDVKMNSLPLFVTGDNIDEIHFQSFDYVADAIDTITAKLLIIEMAFKRGVPIISSMGAGNKLDPTLFRTGDIYQTSVCPLAKVMRRELKKRGIEKLKTVFSTEEPVKPFPSGENLRPGKNQVPGSVAFVPGVAGLIMAGEIIKDIARK